MEENMAALEPDRAKQLVKEGGKAFALPAGVMGGIITTENDVIRIFGITLSNWLLIMSFTYSIIHYTLLIIKSLRKTEGKEGNSES